MEKRARVSTGNLAAAGHVGLQFFQLRNSKSAGYVRQPVIETQQDHFVEPLPLGLTLPRVAGYSVIPKAAQRFGEICAVGGNHAAFSSRNVFYRMKAED